MKNKFRKIKSGISLLTLFVFIVFLIQCSELRNDIPPMDTTCQAAECHISTILKSSLPGTGKHPEHLNLNYDCNYCHHNYLDNNNHKNGINDFDNGARVVFFDTSKAGGSAGFTDNTDTTGVFTCEIACHPGAPSADWYRLDSPDWNCDVCHNSAKPNRRQIVGAAGDFGQNTLRISHHISGSADPTKAQCLVCHDQSTHTAGTVRLRDADSSSDIFVYNPADPSTLELFCLSCHDGGGATTTFIGGSAFDPFNDGQTLGAGLYVASDKIEGYWNNTSTVHKDSGLTCAGTGEPNTGCHGSNGSINMHGSVSKGILTKNMNFSIPTTFTVPYFTYDNYKLCLDCHDSYPAVSKEVVFGAKQSGDYDKPWAPIPYYTTVTQTRFIDRYIDSSGDYPAHWGGSSPVYHGVCWLGESVQLHVYHLIGDLGGWLNWKYRGDSLQVGRITCTTCHNVHGTAGSFRSIYDEFGIISGTNGPDEYKQLINNSDAVFTNYPINCNTSCHSMCGQSYYWHTPSGE